MRAGASRSTGCTRGCGAAAGLCGALAFLELMTPSLEDAIDELAATGVGAITVVPVFFGQGGHLRRDFPLLIDACRAKYPGWRSALRMRSAKSTACSMRSRHIAR
jgi:hypothetical protein